MTQYTIWHKSHTEPAVRMGMPTSFEVNGKQYVAIATGAGISSRARLINTDAIYSIILCSTSSYQPIVQELTWGR